ncbi:MAG TPA: hypothetical protein VIW03_07760 [Anaeromyxobacter sp.]
MKDDVGRVSGEIESLRNELGGLVAELGRRRREAFDVRLQVRRHPIVVAVAAVAAALVVGGLVAMSVRGRRIRSTRRYRAGETRRAMARIFDHPERVGAHPSMGHKVATAVLTVVATTLAKRALARQVVPERQVLPPRR